MGKTTDKHIKEISDAGTACTQTALQLFKLFEAWTKICADWDKYEPEMIRLPDWEQHPYAKMRIKAWEKGMALSNELKNNTNKMNAKLGNFRTFVDKKSKKKTMKGKKSLPMAKDMIQMFLEVIKDYNKIYSVARSKFH